MPDDAALMRHALEAAALAIAHGGGPFGALVADPSGTILAVAANDVLVRVDPTGHSEVNAIRRAAAVRRTPLLDGCTLVTTCAPCLMCAGAIQWARLARVVVAARVADAEALGFGGSVPGWDAVAHLRSRGIAVAVDVSRDAAVDVMRRYGGPKAS
jgi:tRNA(Arg) A34 adenosine deaminase TadA